MTGENTTTVTVTWEPLTEEEKRPTTVSGGGIMIPVEYPARGQGIWECRECMKWEAQVDIVNGVVVVREWHQEGCEILAIIQGSCHGGGILPPGAICVECGAYNPNEP